MPSAHFNPGQIIFSEGDKSNEAYYLVSGLVEISIATPHGAQSLAKLGPGEVFGEMGMIMDRPRTATATALEPTLVEIIHEQEFESYFIQNPQRLHAYLATLFERIRKTDLLLRVATQNQPVPPSQKTEGKREPAYRVRLRSCYERTGSPHKAVDLTITKLPFRVGRAYFDTAVASLARNDVSIEDHAPYQLSRNHCEIDFEHGHFVLRDRGSKLGSIVNGEVISMDSGKITARLKKGDNEIVFGTHGSPHVFTLNIEELS
jgi:CRP-like cAMP-binding protein